MRGQLLKTLLQYLRAPAARSAEEFGDTFKRAMPMCAGLLVAGAVLAWVTIRKPEPAGCHPGCKVHCGVTAPPLDPGEQDEHPSGHPEQPGQAPA